MDYMAKEILRLPAVKAKTGLSRSTIYLRSAQGRFPRSISMGPRCVGWLADEIEGWIIQRIQERDARADV